MEKITPSMLTDKGICPTCYNKEHNYCLSGDNKDKISLIVDEYKRRKYDVYNLEYLKKYYKDSDVTNFLDVVNKKLNSEGF